MSATQTDPSGATATPSGALNCPAPVPLDPNCEEYVPAEVSTCTRSLPVSATQRLPAPSTATPDGWRNCPFPLPYDPNCDE